MAKSADSIGTVVHYYDKIGVAIIELTGDLKKGDVVTFTKGENVSSCAIDSMQIEHQDVEEAHSGDSVGVKVGEKVDKGAVVTPGAPPSGGKLKGHKGKKAGAKKDGGGLLGWLTSLWK